MASITISEVVAERAAKMPPQWNQRTPSTWKSCFQSTSPGLSCEAADQERSERRPALPRLWPAGPRPSTIRAADRRAHAEALLGEVESYARRAADAVEGHPLDV